MTDDVPLQHPPEFRRLCDDAVEGFRALAAAEPMERGRMIPGLREMLHDGLLHRHGMIDMEAIDTALMSTNPHHRHQLRVLELGNAEAWARKWSA